MKTYAYPPPSLIFPNTSDKVGRPYAIAQHQDADIHNGCRELIQNALDAHSLATTDDICRVCFEIQNIKIDDLPGINNYRQAIKSCIDSWPKGSEDVKNYLNALKQCSDSNEAEVLFVVDNGVGFTASSMEAVLAEGSPEKPAGSSGSFGVGHLTAFGLSELQYVCYASKNDNGELLFAGHSILASHKDKKDELRSHHGYYVVDYTPLFDAPYKFCTDENDIPKVIRDRLDKIEGSGSIIAILGFKGFSGKEDESDSNSKMAEELLQAIAENFAVAICTDKLQVTVSPHHKSERVIKKDSIIEFLEMMARPETGTIEATNEARWTLEAIATLNEANEADAKGHLDGEFKDCEIHMRNRAKSHSVSIWRNGMRITKKYSGLSARCFVGKKPFNALILLSGRGGSRVAHDLIKKAEDPMHTKIARTRLNPKDKKELSKLLEHIRKWLSNGAIDSGGEIVDLQDDISFDSGSVMKEMIERSKRRIVPVDGKGDDEDELTAGSGDSKGTGPGLKREKTTPAIIERNIVNAQIQGRITEKNSVVVRIKPQKNISQAMLRLYVDTGQDYSCTGNIKNPVLSVYDINDSQTEFKEEDGVKLQELKDGESIDIRLQIRNTDQNLDEISIIYMLEEITNSSTHDGV